jgi:serine/threonine protein kinase
MSDPAPVRPAADRNLLFGILALQMDFISRGALITAMNAWVIEKTKPLGHVLLDQQALHTDAHQLLEALVQKHLELHGNDPEKSLAALSSLGSVRKDLEQIADAGVQASLVHVSAPQLGAVVDPNATTEPSVGMSTSSGLRFRVLRPHDKGALGEVFVARDEELPREVALKQIQERHADNPESRARFVLEAEVTGGLEHPGIVPVYGLGKYADGRPFYAMRFIKGDNLKEAIKRFHEQEVPSRGRKSQEISSERNVQFRQLLRRFIDVCNAIAYAHSRGVLHRDLKPGNIMLGKYGETLVVDWGLAKVGIREDFESGKPVDEPTLRPQSSSGHAQTVMGTTIGTPAFMSPEQAVGQLDQLGPASDIYSLGATLYVLLTGRPPITGEDVGAVLARARRGDFLAPAQAKAGVPLALDAICRKAMALKPGDRYASAQDLAGDIEHWLADEPVSAFRDPLRERLARWARRHKTLVTSSVAAGVVILLALAAGLVLSHQAKERETVLRLVAENEERQALAARALAEQKEKEATEFANFLRDLFLTSDPVGLQISGFSGKKRPGPDTPARDLLQLGVDKIQGALANAPLARASVLDSLGNVYCSLALTEQAERLVIEASEIRKREHADELEMAASQQSLGLVRFYKGEFDEAEDLFRATLATRRNSLASDDLKIADTSIYLAGVLAAKSITDRLETRFDEIESLLETVLRIRTTRLGEDHRDVGVCYLYSGLIQLDRGKQLQGIASIQRGLESLHAPGLTTETIMDYAKSTLLWKTGKYEEALVIFKRVRDRAEDWLGRDHPFTLVARGAYAGELHRLGRDDEAMKDIREVLEAVKRTPFRYHPKVLDGLIPAADYEFSKQRYAEADSMYREALVIAQRAKNQTKVQELSRKIDETARRKAAGEARR